MLCNLQLLYIYLNTYGSTNMYDVNISATDIKRLICDSIIFSDSRIHTH